MQGHRGAADSAAPGCAPPPAPAGQRAQACWQRCHTGPLAGLLWLLVCGPHCAWGVAADAGGRAGAGSCQVPQGGSGSGQEASASSAERCWPCISAAQAACSLPGAQVGAELLCPWPSSLVPCHPDLGRGHTKGMRTSQPTGAAWAKGPAWLRFAPDCSGKPRRPAAPGDLGQEGAAAAPSAL